MKLELNEREIYMMKRRRLGITMVEVAEYLGVHQSSISRYERGQINLCCADQYMRYIDEKESKQIKY